MSELEAVTARTEISVIDGAPLVVRGPVLVTDAEGGEFPLRRKAMCFRAFERAARVDGGERAS